MKRCLTVFLGVLLLGGCATVKPFQYYRLQASAQEAELKPAGSIGVAPVVLPDWMGTAMLTWSDGAYRIHRSDLQRWGGELDKMVEQIVRQNLSINMGGNRVSSGPWLGDQRPEYVVVLELDNLIRKGDSVALEASWRIEDSQRKAVYQSSAYIREVVVARGLDSSESLVEGFSQVLADLSSDIVSQLTQFQ